MHTTHFVLLQAQVPGPAQGGLVAAAQAVCAGSPLPLALHRLAAALEGEAVYCYLRLAQPVALDAAAAQALAALLQAQCPAATAVRAARLETVFDVPGHSAAAAPGFHYVVETDAEDGWMPEIARWYDTEHMPGLAAVPGCIHAMRLLNRDQGPLSLACYDLTTADTLGSPPWLAVRGTAWSDRARPHFVNTRRTMFRVLA